MTVEFNPVSMYEKECARGVCVAWYLGDSSILSESVQTLHEELLRIVDVTSTQDLL